jgi:hypothetical protein
VGDVENWQNEHDIKSTVAASNTSIATAIMHAGSWLAPSTLLHYDQRLAPHTKH